MHNIMEEPKTLVTVARTEPGIYAPKPGARNYSDTAFFEVLIFT